MMTMGSDFQFENAHQNFKNLDKLIKYVNMAVSTVFVNTARTMGYSSNTHAFAVGLLM